MPYLRRKSSQTATTALFVFLMFQATLLHSRRLATPGRLGVIADQDLLLRQYFSNQELGQYIDSFVQRCSHISRKISFGNSVSGEQLLGLEITGTSSAATSKPYFRYLGQIHGDEPSGRQLLLALAEHLCSHYPRDATVAALLDGLRLIVIPSLNPDGYELHMRENKNGMDLNRDFPDRVLHKGHNLTQPVGTEQPETLALMSVMLKYRPVAALNLHEGALLANYPWDGYTNGSLDLLNVDSRCPDDVTFRFLATTYARLHTTMHASENFPSGITNGAHWYPLYGGLQDWAYVAVGCMEVTLELNDDKSPAIDRLAQMWEENRQALLTYPLIAVYGGIRGHITDALGKPLKALINLANNRRSTMSNPKTGMFFRPLAPGKYSLHVTASGYQSVTIDVVVPANGTGVALDLQLQPASNANSSSSPSSAFRPNASPQEARTHLQVSRLESSSGNSQTSSMSAGRVMVVAKKATANHMGIEHTALSHPQVDMGHLHRIAHNVKVATIAMIQVGVLILIVTWWHRSTRELGHHGTHKEGVAAPYMQAAERTSLPMAIHGRCRRPSSPSGV